MTTLVATTPFPRSDRLARRALGFALAGTMSPAEAADQLVLLAAGNPTALLLARARLLKGSCDGPSSRWAARVLLIAQQRMQTEG